MLHVGKRLGRCQPAFEVKSLSAIDMRSWILVGLEASRCTSAVAQMPLCSRRRFKTTTRPSRFGN